ncbi:amidohydrolase family protein [Aggregatimonas sangjinii]|uniref:Amidohydrolase family protein n=1 Tax=Aggregatimonas sangjinii TaxID=2583587 RepID=A0A5B7SKH6_9FLAO|nr:amidohydrolase family protein [Aggregatimonas sangjinii]QCW98986.1 amidohydrolase family protein [Aggregatimonas sangjinii]
MKKTTLKILKFILLFVVIGAIGSYLYIDYELHKILGRSTEVINISSIITPSSSVQIRNVALLSEDCSYFNEKQNVLLQDGKIVAIDSNTTIDKNIKIVDGTNKYLIPGLVDSHVHLKESKNDLYLYLINGVTSIREMAGNSIALNWKKSIDQDDEIGPRMFIASKTISSVSGLEGYYHEWTRQGINYTTKEDAQKAIEEIKQEGYDAIKMYSFVTPEMFKTTIEIAEEFDIPVIGHIPNKIRLDTFYTAGQKEVAHIEELTKQNMDDFEKSIARNPEEYIEFLKSRSNQIAKELKKNHICVVSTANLMESLPIQKFDLESKLKEIPLQYVNPKILEGTSIVKLGWLPTRNPYEYDGIIDVEQKRLTKIFWETYVEAIRIMTKSLMKYDVTILAGTDANVPPMVPGFSLHEELKTLSKYGMTNTEVLYAATVAPNEWMKRKSGRIKVGYDSDLVLLSKNPLEDIENVKTIEYVFVNESIIDKNQINDILQSIEQVNGKNRSLEIDEFVK